MDNLFLDNATPAVIGNLLTSTGAAIDKEVVPAAFNETYPALAWLEKNRKSADYGTHIVIPIEKSQNSNSEYTTADALVKTNNDNVLTEALFWPKLIYSGIVISQDQLSANQGQQKLLDLLRTKKENMYNTVAARMNAAILNAAPGAYDPWSLPEICSSSDPAAARGNIGNVDRDTYSWYQSNLTSSTGSFGALGLSIIDSMLATIAPSKGMPKPKFAITTATIYNYLTGNAFNRVQLVNTKDANIGIENVTVNGVQFTYDADCPSGYILWLSPDQIQLRVWKGFDKKTSPFIQPPNSWTFVSLFGYKHQIIVKDPGKVGCNTGITA